ncbi:MAG TPA: MBL fold metallo-hydrolase [Candidatus Merdiplasma excrementigallinarum]|uniref:MBL fold metallo-hydrolase n=1 Tax=Candidatus Merdiplasma excrementigallinarum TaxID=2840864 RepID=A0A9D1T8W7_9FIRM|nr:MBL fold metallo-hydrolase [Candidatus Merdiplasma excrementigallinarum]
MEYCSIASGSSGNCIYVGSDHAGVLVDAGISGKKISEGLQSIDRKPEELDGILITHEHSDHIRGLGVLSRKYGIPIYATRGTIGAIRDCAGLGAIDGGLFHEIYADEVFSVEDLEICPFAISHDAAEPVAYRIRNGNKSMAVATDMGCYNDYIVEHLKGVNGILLEANHDVNMLQVGTYPYPLKQRILGRLGHLSNDNAGRLLCEILHDDLKSIVLGHLSRENNYEALAYATVCAEITMGDNPYKADDFPIQVAKRDQALPVIAL